MAVLRNLFETCQALLFHREKDGRCRAEGNKKTCSSLLRNPVGRGPGWLVSTWESVSLTRILAFLGTLSSAEQENYSFNNRVR